MNPLLGQMAALATALCWTISTLSFTDAARRSGTLSVNIIRLAIAWLLLAGYGLCTRGLALPSDATGHAWLWLSISGLVGFFLGDLCLFKAYMLIGPRLTALLMSLAAPMTAALGLIVFGASEALTLQNWIGVVITILGVTWVVLERSSDANGVKRRPSAGGVALGFLAATGQAVGAILSKLGMGDVLKPYDAFASTQIRVTAGMFGFAVLLLALRWYPRVLETLRSPRAMASLTLGAFAGPCLGVSLFLLSMQHVKVGIAQTLVNLVPVLVIPFVIVLYRERVSWRAIAGACIAIAGVVLLFLRHS